ncbi:hypothetical protein [Thiospirochaeta perfilievii]|nr:hypothetical protein [Thiospirochaeta perfilievii]
MKKILTILLLTSSFFLFSQEDDFFSDDVDFEDMNFDDMFGEEGDDTFLEVVEDQSDEVAAPSSELLTTNGVEFGGTFSSSISAGVTYSDFPGVSDIFKDYDDTFTPSLSATLYFNARPTEDTRFFGKVSTDIPFYKSAKVLLANEDYVPGAVYVAEDPTKTNYREGTPATVSIPEIKIEELFTDFNYKNRVFFRVGKQNAKWGVGYFFSPADFLSLESIDPENPTADREGPIAIKVSAPFGLNNLYTYITVPNSVFETGDASVTDLIIAPMFQVLLGDTEVSSGIYYQKDSAPRAMLSATYGTNTNYGQFSFFGEAVGLYGSDKTFIKEDYTTVTYDDKLFFNGTAGFMWSKEIANNNFSLVGQYYYNGEGYEKNSNIIKNVMAPISGVTPDVPVTYSGSYTTLLTDFLAGDSDLTFSDVANRSRHYLGASFGISNLFDNEDLSLSAYTMMNLADISGFVKSSISYTFFDGLSASLGTTINFSDRGDEYFGDKFAIDLTFNLGGGSF